MPSSISEVARVEAAIKNKGVKELEWSIWYCQMRQSIPSARPADVRYWSKVEEMVQSLLTPPVEVNLYPSKKKKRGERGLGSGRSLGETEPAATKLPEKKTPENS